MTFTLYGYEHNPRTRVVRIVAAAEGIELNHVEVVPRKNIGKEEYMAKFPLSSGKIPGLEGPGVMLTETLAIVTYLASISNNAKLLGDGSKEQAAQVLSWMSWANQELLQTLALWFLPLIPNFTDPAPYNKSSVDAGKTSSLHLLSLLENILSTRTYLVGDHLTLADIMVAIYVSRGLEWVLDSKWRMEHPNIMRHFEVVANQGPVKEVIPKFVLIEKETPNIDPKEESRV
ncbi:glutathione-S-transferase theta, GST [Wilcoxina mikolae CBS 423.85]|nr:glutathione-S-transferase theta, GST [Wilcoxina mikolae CBS 423.85]